MEDAFGAIVRLAPVIGTFVGIWFGWRLNQQSTRENTRTAFENQKTLADQTLHGQRLLAADAAKRERRKLLIDAYRMRIRERIDKYQELGDALARHDWQRSLDLFDALGRVNDGMGLLTDVTATGDQAIYVAGIRMFNVETDIWNEAVQAFNAPSFAAIAAVGGPAGEMMLLWGVLNKGIDEYVTRVDSEDQSDLRDSPDARPPIPVDYVRMAPRRDVDHPWFGQPPLMSSQGAEGKE